MKVRMTPYRAQLRGGIYRAVAEKIEPQVGNFGEYLRWQFMALTPKGEAVTISGLTSCIFSKRSKLYDWASTICGKAFDVNEELDTEMLHGKPCRLWLVIKPLEDGSINAIKEVLPPEETPPSTMQEDDDNPFDDDSVPF
jgi:hypothetical protein